MGCKVNHAGQTILTTPVDVSDADWEALPETCLGHLKYRVVPPEARKLELRLVNVDLGVRLKTQAAACFKRMVDSAEADGIHLFARTGFRDIHTQEQIFQTRPGNTLEEKARVAAPPHFSEHHTGFAVDINSSDGPITKRSAAYQWLEKNAKRFGFVNSFPKSNAQHLGEPWHWRYQGDPQSQETFKRAIELSGPDALADTAWVGASRQR